MVRRRHPELNHPDRRGMTMVELLVAMALFSVVIGIAFAFLTNTRRGYDALTTQVEYQQSMRAVMSLISREIRSAGCNANQAGVVAYDRFPAADVSSLQCMMDLDGDGNTWNTSPSENVVYDWDAGAEELTRDPGTGPQVILRNVTDVEFNYFDANNNELTSVPLNQEDRDAVRYVIVRIAGESDDGAPMEYETTVLIRNN